MQETHLLTNALFPISILGDKELLDRYLSHAMKEVGSLSILEMTRILRVASQSSLTLYPALIERIRQLFNSAE